jgi:hypothetical protein
MAENIRLRLGQSKSRRAKMNSNAEEQAERRRVFENDKRVMEGSTYFAQAQASAMDEMGGRFAKVQPTSVTGSAPTAWPKMPEGNPWACDPMPPEPPLGYAVDAQDPVGEPHEIAASQGSTVAASAVGGTPSPSPSDDSHVITKQGGVGRVQFKRRI